MRFIVDVTDPDIIQKILNQIEAQRHRIILKLLFNPNHTPEQKGQINSARPFNLLSDQPNSLQAQPPAALKTIDNYCLHIAYPDFCPIVLNQDTLAIWGKCGLKYLST